MEIWFVCKYDATLAQARDWLSPVPEPNWIQALQPLACEQAHPPAAWRHIPTHLPAVNREAPYRDSMVRCCYTDMVKLSSCVSHYCTLSNTTFSKLPFKKSHAANKVEPNVIAVIFPLNTRWRESSLSTPMQLESDFCNRCHFSECRSLIMLFEKRTTNPFDALS